MCDSQFGSAHAQNKNHCVQLLFDDFNNPPAWTPISAMQPRPSIRPEANLILIVRQAPGTNRQYQFCAKFIFQLQAILGELNCLSTAETRQAITFLTLYETGPLILFHLTLSGGCPTLNDAIIVDLTAQYGPATASS